MPFFSEQWGGVSKKRAGRELDGRSHDARTDSAAKDAPSRRIRLQLPGEFTAHGVSRGGAGADRTPLGNNVLG